MKKMIFLLGLLLFFSFTNKGIALQTPDVKTMVDEKNDKKILLNYFRVTSWKLYKSIEGLSEAQLQFKPSEEQWSISQCLEHIILTEKMLFEMAQEQMEKPENPESRSEIKFTDEDLLKGVLDRSQKAKATSELEGEGEYINPADAIKDFDTQRPEIINYIRQTELKEFRNRVNDTPFGAVDTYQFFLFIAGHMARHTLQIEEIKQSENFPSEQSLQFKIQKNGK